MLSKAQCEVQNIKYEFSNCINGYSKGKSTLTILTSILKSHCKMYFDALISLL